MRDDEDPMDPVYRWLLQQEIYDNRKACEQMIFEHRIRKATGDAGFQRFMAKTLHGTCR
jgi:hypothetical protein